MFKDFFKRITVKLILVLFCLFYILFMNVIEVNATKDNSNSSQYMTTELPELEKFIDEYFYSKMEEYHVPGAALVLVKDGNVFFSKGYGYADIEKKVPVDDQKTLFRVASVSKIFTITSILQLADKGIVELDEDVNHYLMDFKARNDFNEPIKISHLLTHTDGFGTRDLSTFAHNATDLIPLGHLLARELTSPVQKPGSVVTYGGYGTALAGFLVEQVSGLTFEEYVNKNIFNPLQMHHSTFNQLLPKDLGENVSTTYYYDDNQEAYAPVEFLYVNTPPTGGASTTAKDMANFIRALLNDGRIDNTQVLSEATVELMLNQQFTAHPKLPGVTYGFMEDMYNNQRGLVRDGSGLGIRSQVYLLPEHNLGYFFVQNARGDAFIEDFNRAFLDEYFPVTIQKPIVDKGYESHNLSRFSGTYRPAQTAEHTLVKIEALAMGEIKVIDQNDGSLLIKPLGMGDVYGGFLDENLWTQVEPLLFTRVDEESYLAFGEDEDGKITYLFSGSGYHGSYYRIPWYETSKFQLTLLGLYMAIFLLNIIFWPIRAFFRSKSTGKTELMKNIKYTELLCLLISFLNISALSITLYDLFIKKLAGLPAFAFGVSFLAKIMLGILLVTSILNILLLISVFKEWKNKLWVLGERTVIVLSIIAIFGFTIWLNYWNLLGFKF